MRVLDRWEGKLTWPALCNQVASVLQVDSVSRHTLMHYEEIRHRFAARQQELEVAKEACPRDYTLEAAKKQIAALEAEVSRLRDQNGNYVERFTRWQYNAFLRGMTPEQLEEPMPKVNRSGHRNK